jgi:uncharacterized damage-inducible protein DinB
VHLLAVEWLWLERWRGQSPTTLIAPSELPTLPKVEGRWRAVEREMRARVDTLDEAALSATRSFLSTRGERWTHPLWRTLVHVLTHQAAHRRQVTSQLRLLGWTPPRVDFLVGRDVDFGS